MRSGALLRSRVATVLQLRQERCQGQGRQQLNRKPIASSTSRDHHQRSRPRQEQQQQQLHLLASPAPAPPPPRHRRAETMTARAATDKEKKAAATTPTPPVRVLLTNDDGPLSPFFVAWVAHVRSSLGWKVFVAPPAEGQSFVSKAVATGSNHASGSSSKSSNGISLTRVDEETVHVSGPPATAVNLVLHHLSPECDFVVSGPNVGHNVGRGSVLSSGTVGAALEGAVAGKKSVALSFPFKNGFGNWTEDELRLAVEASGKVVAGLWESWGEGVDLYNVNVPLDFNRKEGEGEGNVEGFEFEVSATTVDPGAQYSSLYRKVASSDSESEHEFEWGPSGLRVFDEAANRTQAVAGGDVEAVRGGRISVSALRAALAHVEEAK